MKRRGFLQLLAAAPIAALVPWRAPVLEHYHATLGPVAFDPWQEAMIERLLKARIMMQVNPPIVVDGKDWRYFIPPRSRGRAQFIVLDPPPIPNA